MARTTLLAVLKFLMALIFAAWVSLWLLKPTQFWTRKWKAAEDLARPTLFGYYGLNYAVYTFPLFALAIVGSVYLNLKPREPIKRKGRRVLAGFSNPLVVNNLLGVLSSMEIVAVFLFMLLLAWTFYVRISSDFKKLKPDKALNLNLWQLQYLRVATRFGLLAEACLAFLLLPVLRGLAVFRILGIQFEASIRYHIWLGTTMLFCATFHGVSTLFIWGVSHHIQDEVWKWQNTGRIYLAGEICLVTGLVIWITALPQIRRKKFEIFYYTHHLYMVFLLFFLFHAGDRHFYAIFPGIFLFGLDKLLRIIQSRPETCILSAIVFPSKAIELVLPKDPGLKYTPTSVLFLKVPSISKYQWHSFSIISSSSVDANSMSVLIKSEGSWTSALSNLIQTQQKSDADYMKCVPVAVEGPYGPASMEFLRYDSLLLVAGGIGITPFLSIIQELVAVLNSVRYKVLPRMQLVFAVKKAQDICLLNSISPLIFNQPAEKCHLKVKVYVTQEEQSGVTVREAILDESSRVQTVNFDIKSSNYAITGLESPLCVAAIAGISYILFLILLIIFNHIFIPSQNKTTKGKTPSLGVDLLIICSFIAMLMCISLVPLIVRWRRLKKQNRPVFQKQGKALEISPTEARDALEEHEIHFGGRPNFEEIFAKFPNEIGGSDVGVLVCGPQSMKDSVASICQHKSGGLKVGAKNNQKANFRFHSLNFAL
ncbi:ferric reduction oxidase 8, mitochondrial [Argentina anserina]|uniref:ferric reduction oxidase 8, mitochondrial n=1 Tax=Argentina anserina TaxID=57926 RepID=UPI00217678FC|nr:ferric reduction oxidase 8, mitochondrial [Potentilla anserina]